MKNKFSILFRLIIHHSYFKDGICDCIRFSPGPLTRQLLRRYNYNYAERSNTFDFFGANAQNLFFEHITRTTGIDHFDIELVTTDPCFYNFTKLPPGHRGELTYDTQEITNYFEKDSLYLQGRPAENTTGRFATVNIHFDDIAKYKKNNGPALFAIGLDTRSTQWQYFIVNTNGLRLEDPVIKKDEFRFTGPASVSMKNGQQALFFSSGDKLLPLQEVPSYRFSLSCQAPGDNSVSKTIIKTLPCPRPSHFDLVEMNGTKEMASPMYVFI